MANSMTWLIYRLGSENNFKDMYFNGRYVKFKHPGHVKGKADYGDYYHDRIIEESINSKVVRRSRVGLGGIDKISNISATKQMNIRYIRQD